MEENKGLDFSGQTIYSGIDVHKKSWLVSIHTQDFEHKTFTQRPKPEELVAYLRRNFPGAKYKAVYESGYSGFWIQKSLTQLGVDCIVAHAADIPTTDKDRRRKNDPRDARKQSLSLKAGQLEGIYIPSDQAIADRSFMRTRSSLVKDQSRIKNRIKSLLLFEGIDIPDDFTERYWSGPLIEWLRRLKMKFPTERMTLDNHLRQLAHIRKQIADATKAIRRLSQTERYRDNVRYLTSIPGIGLSSAMIWLTELIDINRFKGNDHLNSYIGLIPGEHSTGEKTRKTEMEHRGNSRLRTLLIENSWAAIRKDPALLMSYTELKKRMSGNKAIIRIARKLLNRIRYVLRNQTEYVVAVVE